MRSSGLGRFRVAAVALFGLLAASCAGVDRYDAAGNVHAFLISIRNGDTQTFNAYVDRPALKEQLRARLLAAAARRGGAMGAMGAFLAQPLVGLLRWTPWSSRTCSAPWPRPWAIPRMRRSPTAWP